LAAFTIFMLQNAQIRAFGIFCIKIAAIAADFFFVAGTGLEPATFGL
jgi:hypothetical protein